MKRNQLLRRMYASNVVKLPGPSRREMVGEVLFADPSRIFPGQLTVYNPSSLVTRRGLRIFAKMRQDDQIKAALQFKKHAVLAAGWEVVSPKDEGSDWEVTEAIRENLTEITTDERHLDDLLIEVLSGLDFGFSVSEKEFDFSEGQVWLEDLRTVAPFEIEFEQDPHGRLLKIRQVTGYSSNQTTIGTNGIEVPLEKVVLFTHQREFSNLYGTSDLEAAYRAWVVKDNTYRWLAMYLEKLGIPPIFALYNPQMLAGTPLTQLQTVLERLQAATFGAIPRMNKDDIEFWSPQSTSRTNEVFIPAIDMFNRDMARAILMPSLIGMTADQQQGSFARSQTHFDVFLLVVEKLRKQLAAVMNTQIVRPLVIMNFGIQERYPEFRWLPMDDALKVELLKQWKEMVAQKIVTPQKSDEEHIRAVLRMPERQKGDELEIEPEPPPVPPAGQDPNQPPAAEEGGEDEEGKNKDTDEEELDEEEEEETDEEETDEAKMAKTDGLYVRRQLTNAQQLHDWAEEQGIPNLTPPEQMHVTNVYSRKKIQLDPKTDSVIAKGGARSIEPLGDKGAVVLMFKSEGLSDRWQEAMDKGAEWEYETGFRPHVTLTYDAGDFDISTLTPPDFALEFGPEIHEPINEDWATDNGLRKHKLEELLRVDYAAIDDALHSLEDRVTEDMKAALEEVRAKLVKKVDKRFEGDPKFIKDLGLTGFAPVKRVIRGFLRDVFDMGRRDLRQEIQMLPQYSQQAAKPYAAPLYTPREALRWLESKEFWVSGVLEERVLNQARGILLNAAKNGEDGRETIRKLDDLFSSYLGDEDIIDPATGDALVTPHRLNTIVRTNMTDAYNVGRLTEARDPALEGFIRGMVYSAVLDDRTTEQCRLLDGKIIPMDEPALDRLEPPNHYNCRSILVAVPYGIAINESDVITADTIGAALALIPSGFGGSV